MSLMLFHASHVSFHIQETDVSDGQQKKRKGRGITLKQNIYSRGGGPKIRIVLNGPIGNDSKEFGNFVGSMVRKHIPVTCDD